MSNFSAYAELTHDHLKIIDSELENIMKYKSVGFP